GLHWKRQRGASCSFKMISFSNINKQYGKQLLFVDASFQLNPGEISGTHALRLSKHLPPTFMEHPEVPMLKRATQGHR
ncbi:MAG: hypothetical protein WCA20_02860, partial [Candidatus Sulfotelmatobacter sp.]